jgi:alkylhydroperoxidase family enzyme
MTAPLVRTALAVAWKELTMPWIKVTREAESEGELKEAYVKMREVNDHYAAINPQEQPLDASPGGAAIGPPTLSSLNPQAMLHARELMMEIMRGPSGLTPVQREMIATVTSVTTDCRY